MESHTPRPDSYTQQCPLATISDSDQTGNVIDYKCRRPYIRPRSIVQSAVLTLLA